MAKWWWYLPINSAGLFERWFTKNSNASRNELIYLSLWSKHECTMLSSLSLKSSKSWTMLLSFSGSMTIVRPFFYGNNTHFPNNLFKPIIEFQTVCIFTLINELKFVQSSMRPFLARLNSEYNNDKSLSRFSSSKLSSPLCRMPVKCSESSCFSTVKISWFLRDKPNYRIIKIFFIKKKLL